MPSLPLAHIFVNASVHRQRRVRHTLELFPLDENNEIRKASLKKTYYDSPHHHNKALATCSVTPELEQQLATNNLTRTSVFHTSSSGTLNKTFPLHVTGMLKDRKDRIIRYFPPPSSGALPIFAQPLIPYPRRPSFCLLRHHLALIESPGPEMA